MSFSQAIQSVFSQYTGFRGRARRSEYWFFVLFNIIVHAVIGALVGVCRMSDNTRNALITVWELAVFLPNLAVTVRRMHDIGKSGWTILFALIPIVGAIILLVYELRDSQPGTNQYGTSVKYPHGIPFVRTQGGTQGSYYVPYSNHTPTSSTATYQPPQTDYQPSQYNDQQSVQPEAPAEEETGIVCPSCGTRNVAGSKFCTSCGTPLNQ